MNFIKISFGTLAVCLSMQCSSPSASTATTTTTENNIKNKIESGAMIVDVRTHKEFSEGTFEDAVNIPLNQIEDRIEEFQGKKEIIVFCRSGRRSQKAIEILEKHGIENVSNGINQKNLEKIMK